MFSHSWDCSRWGQPSTALTATPLKKGRLTSSWHPQDKTPLPMKRWEISTSQTFSRNLYSETSIDKTWWWPYKAETCCFTSNLKNIHLLYRVSQEEWTKLQKSVPYFKLYRYNPKHLYPKLNGYGDNVQRSLKLWQLLLTYWLPNTYWNLQEYVVSVMLISVLNIKVTCEWHKAIKKTTKTLALLLYLSLGVQVLYVGRSWSLSCDVRATVRWLHCMSRRACTVDEYAVTDGVQYMDPREAHTFRRPLSP